MDNTSFDQCIKCTACTVYCPVSKYKIDFLGPKHYGPDAERLRRKHPDYFDPMMDACTNCKRCEIACPSGVRIGDLIAVSRKQYGKKKFNPKWVRDFVLSHTDLMGTVATPIAPIVNAITANKPAKELMHKGLGVDKHKSLPRYSTGTFRGWFKKQVNKQQEYTRQVHYFHGCYVNYNNPQQGKDLVKLLNAMNIGVSLLKKERCCGVPLIANGFFDKATSNAKLNIDQMEKAISKQPTPIISSSSTCYMTLRDEYPHILGVENDKVRDNIQFITRFLLQEFMQGNQPQMSPLNLTVDYHIPCHLEKSGNHIYTIELLRIIPGLKLNVLNSQCCGSAGTYGFKAENYSVSNQIGSSLFKDLSQSKANLVVTDCETCKWQIEENSDKDCIHPINLLAMALSQLF